MDEHCADRLPFQTLGQAFQRFAGNERVFFVELSAQLAEQILIAGEDENVRGHARSGAE